MKNVCLITSILIMMLGFGCKKKSPVSYHDLKIILSDSLPLKVEGEKRMLPELVRQLTTIIVSDTLECRRVSVPNPSLYRIDINQEFSLKTNIGNGFADPSNPIFIQRSIENNFKDLSLPKAFVTPSKNLTENLKRIETWLSTKARNDLILVLSPDSALKKYSISNKSVPVFGDAESLRKHMLKVLCQNDKANFAVLYNPIFPELPLPPKDPTKKKIKKLVRRKSKLTITTSHSGPSGICNPVTRSLHELVYDENDQPKYGKVLIVNCKECGYSQ